MGLRFQLFSPSPAKKGSANNTARPTAGPINKIGVSAAGGRYDSSAYSHQKKKSGCGAVWMMVGSGCPPGPKGPRKTAQAAIDRSTKPEKRMSFPIAAGTK